MKELSKEALYEQLTAEERRYIYEKVERANIVDDMCIYLENSDDYIDQEVEIIEKDVEAIANIFVAMLMTSDSYFEAYWSVMEQAMEAAKKKACRELYNQYVKEWCEQRGVKPEDVDEEIGINGGECYVCFDEWMKNEYEEMREGEE
ncbi:hypothetical protein M2140_000082 [Clostridiales Family XIII bacterium PM5-7]